MSRKFHITAHAKIRAKQRGINLKTLIKLLQEDFPIIRGDFPPWTLPNGYVVAVSYNKKYDTYYVLSLWKKGE